MTRYAKYVVGVMAPWALPWLRLWPNLENICSMEPSFDITAAKVIKCRRCGHRKEKKKLKTL